jgi:acetyl esterase
MSNIPTREKYIQRGRRIRRMAILLDRLSLRPKKNPRHREVFIETEHGRVRTLWYGFGGTEKATVYFDLHGGGFMMGKAEMDEAMNLELNRQVGCRIISIDYAKAPDHPYPAAVNQVYAVVRHIFENAGQYAIDGSRMGIGGHSAGGNLAAVTCMQAKREGWFTFACQVLDYPPMDLFTSPWEKAQPKGAISPGMAAMFNACYVDPAQAGDPYVSPVFASAAVLQGLPPALFVLAGGDSLHDEGLKYCQMLEAAGVACECHEYPHAPHGFTYRPSPDTTDAVGKMAGFLRKYLF